MRYREAPPPHLSRSVLTTRCSWDGLPVLGDGRLVNRLTRTMNPTNATNPIKTHKLPNPARTERTQIETPSTIAHPMYFTYLKVLISSGIARKQSVPHR